MGVSGNLLCPEGVSLRCGSMAWAASAYGVQAWKEKGIGAEQAWKEHVKGNSCFVGPAQCYHVDPI